ncbi:hypothetical protein ACQX3Y_10405, partial [Corynebacterium diphtheriae]
PANPSQAMVVKNVLLRVVPRLNPRRANQCTLKLEEPIKVGLITIVINPTFMSLNLKGKMPQKGYASG